MNPLFVDGLSPAAILTIEGRMRDRDFSRSGFLGIGESLVQRIRADALTLGKLGIAHAQIADRLEAVVLEARRLDDLRRRTPEYELQLQALSQRLLDGEDASHILQEGDAAVIVDGRFSVTMTSFRGFQWCPFAYSLEGDSIRTCGEADTDIRIENTRSGTSIRFSELLIHTIRDHQFFEGEGLEYRLDPRIAVETLELT